MFRNLLLTSLMCFLFLKNMVLKTDCIVYSLRFGSVEIFLWAACAMLSRFTIQREKRYAPKWFDDLIVCPFWTNSGKYYSKKCGKLMQL